MGVKRRRFSPSDIIVKNGKSYASSGGRLYRVCECKIFYRHCTKCNDLLANRTSHYVQEMVKHSKQASIKRNKTRPEQDHHFDQNRYYQLLLERMIKSGLECECSLCIEKDEKQLLSIWGPNKMSIDRTSDNIGYTHKDQILRIISKNHHSWQKRDAIPEEAYRRNWLNTTVSHMVKRSKKRYIRTKSELKEMEKAGLDISEMSVYLESHVIEPKRCKTMIEDKVRTTDSCKKCGILLDYGDENGFLKTKNNPRQASPDRINNRIGYISDNVQIVCCSCQTMGNLDENEDIFLDETGIIDLKRFLTDKICSSVIIVSSF